MTIWERGAAALRWRRLRHDATAGLGDLEAALDREECPACAGAAGADERWLGGFLEDGYLDRDVMRRVARAGGFCAHHARRSEVIGLSAPVALVYLAMIHECLPRLARRAEGANEPVVVAPGSCAPCRQAREADRRECFFLALLIGVRGTGCYGAPAIVCTRHLPRLIEYLRHSGIESILALQQREVAALGSHLRQPMLGERCREAVADRAIARILGPPRETASPRDMRAEFAEDPDPVRRMCRRLRRLRACAICAEINDACAEWLAWLTQAARSEGDLLDVLPLCREHVWRARQVAGPALAPALAEAVLREAGERLAYAAAACETGGGTRRLPDAIRRAWPASARDPVRDSLRRGRECPLCRRTREAGDRALSLLVALLESADGRRAFETGYGLCIRHAAQALRLPAPLTIGRMVASTTHARLVLLRWELEEQLRRGAWQARPERRGAESSAWLRAGARFAGTAGAGA